MGRTGAVGLQSLCDHPQKDAQHHIEHWPVAAPQAKKNQRANRWLKGWIRGAFISQPKPWSNRSLSCCLCVLL
jgi:hypothetical protein